MADFDYSELTKLSADLGRASENVGPFLRSAVMVTAGKIKKDAADEVRSSSMWAGAAGAIDYDVVAAPGEALSTLTVEIGYNKGKRGGPLGNLREYGAPDSASGPLAPHNDLLNALEANQADFEKGIARALDDAEKAAGL